MAVDHSGLAPVVLRQAPADPDGTDWVVFSYQAWLRPGESITAHSVTVAGSDVAAVSVWLGDITTPNGVTHGDCYGVQFKPSAGSSSVSATHRVSTSGPGVLGRLNMDHTAIIPVASQ